MSLQVTFDIFSGRPNPVVALEGEAAAQVLGQLEPTAKLSGTKALPPFESVLGYRGLLIEQTGSAKNSTLPLRFRVVDGKLFAPNTAYTVRDAGVEQFVLASVSMKENVQLTPDLIELIAQQQKLRSIVKPLQTSSASATTPSKCPCAPLYEPDWWNDAAGGGARQFYNNCYNYACDYRTDTFAQPGRAAGSMYTALTCAAVQPASVRDALLAGRASKTIQCPKEGHLVALVIWPNSDFHWYRLGRDGLWTHKPGGTPVTNVDNSGKLITDPRTADRGGYTAFCTFMVVMHGHVKIS